MHPSESTGRTDTVQVDDSKLEHTVNQGCISEDERKDGGMDVHENCRDHSCYGADLYTCPSFLGPEVNSFFP